MREVDGVGELLALLGGAFTFDYVEHAGKFELWSRWKEHIESERKWPVFPSHRCGAVYPLVAEPHPLLSPRSPVSEIFDHPPF